MELTLSAKPPFLLSSVIESHGWVRLSPFQKEDNGGLSYLYRLDSNNVVKLIIEEVNGNVRVKTDSQLTELERDEISQSVEWMLALDQDFTSFYIIADREPNLAHMRDKAQGRLLRSPTLFEDTIKTILTTNTSWAGTIRMVDSLVSQFGSSLPSDSSRHAFPTPLQIADTDVSTLRNDTRLGYRAPYVLELAQLVASGELGLEEYKNSTLPTSQLRENLLNIKGVGNYAAANLLMLLGRYDYLPIDSWAMKLVSFEWYDGEPVGPRDVEAAFDHWGEWNGLAYWFWDWKYLQET